MTHSTSHPEPTRRVLLAAGTKTYNNGEFPRLEKVPTSLQTVVQTLTALGYTPHHMPGGYLLDPDTDQLRDEIDHVRETGAEVVVAYYTGHGVHPEKDHYYVLARDSTLRPPRRLRRSALPATELVELLTRRDEHNELHPDQPDVLVILDCCYSGAGGVAALRNALAGISHPRMWIIASAGPLEWARDGRFAEALTRALREHRDLAAVSEPRHHRAGDQRQLRRRAGGPLVSSGDRLHRSAAVLPEPDPPTQRGRVDGGRAALAIPPAGRGNRHQRVLPHRPHRTGPGDRRPRRLADPPGPRRRTGGTDRKPGLGEVSAAGAAGVPHRPATPGGTTARFPTRLAGGAGGRPVAGRHATAGGARARAQHRPDRRRGRPRPRTAGQ